MQLMRIHLYTYVGTILLLLLGFLSVGRVDDYYSNSFFFSYSTTKANYSRYSNW